MSVISKMPRKSKMWLYFKKVDDSTVSCNLCAKYVKSCGNTSNMMKHLNMHSKKAKMNKREDRSKQLKISVRRKSHWLDLENPDNAETSHSTAETNYEVEDKSLPVHQTSAAPTATAFEGISNYSDNHAQISDAILYFICVDCQPLNTVQLEGFKYLMKKLMPHYKIPSKDAIERRLDEKYDAAAQIFKQKLSEAIYLTITTDTWSETTLSASFLGITVHFITNETKKVESGNLEVIELSEYTVDNIACAFVNTLMKWCIHINNVIAVVTNNESNLVDAVGQIFGQDKHITCFAHAINLVAEDSMMNCKGLDDIISKVRSIVKFVRGNVDANDELHQRQIDLGTPENKIKKLILDTKTRWSSIFHMTERFVELWDVIDEILLARHDPPEIPTADELIALREIINLLKPLEFVDRECSAENYITISKVIPLISCALTEYKNITQTTVLSTRLKQVILLEMEKRFGHIEFVNSISIATILDPRFKVIHFQNAQALANAMYLLRDMISKLSNASSSSESDAEQEQSKYDLWMHHKLLAHKPKEEDDGASLQDELSLYLANPLASLKENPLDKWETMRMLYPSLYKMAIKYLSIVATSIPAKELLSKTGAATIRSRNQLTGERMNKILFLNSVHQEYWSQ